MSLLNLTESAPFCVEVLWADHLVKKKHVAASFTDLHTGVWQYRATQTGTKCRPSLLDTGFQSKACVRANLSDRCGTATSQPQMHLSDLTQLYSAVYNFNISFVIYFLQIRCLTTKFYAVKIQIAYLSKNFSDQEVLCLHCPATGGHLSAASQVLQTSGQHRKINSYTPRTALLEVSCGWVPTRTLFL